MNLIALAINPIPSGARTIMFDGYDGTKLRAALWERTRGDARGTMCVFPGRGEYIEKYFEVIADLRRRGFAVAIMDWRGQGGSQRRLSNPRKGHVAGFTEYDRDLALFMAEVVTPNCPPPYIALGHSMGSNILLRGAQNEKCVFARMVLVSPMIVIHDAMMGNSVAVARAYAEVASLFGLATAYIKGGTNEARESQDFDTNPLTSDFVRWSRNKAVLEQAPELGLGSPTIGWLRSALRSCAMIQRHDYPKYIAVPMLMFAAGADQVVSPRAIEDFAVELKIGGHVAMPGSRHEILQESDAIRQRFWAAFDAYMGVTIPAVV